MSDDLIKRLRDCANGIGSFKSQQGDYGLCDDAAHRIEQLEWENARLDAGWSDANRRALDAGLKLAKAVEALRSFKLTCNESSVYKDCTLHFVEPHALSLRLNIGSDKAFIVADFEARRRAVLAELEGGK